MKSLYEFLQEYLAHNYDATAEQADQAAKDIELYVQEIVIPEILQQFDGEEV